MKLNAEELSFHPTDDPMLVQKRIGSVLEQILYEMEENGLVVPRELWELKQWLRFKGNSRREQGDYSLWENY
jgi:hypothetical protein